MEIKKSLYCPKCKEYPDKFIEKYIEPIEEVREWNEENEDYGLIDSNIDSVICEQICAKCGTKLEYKLQD